MCRIGDFVCAGISRVATPWLHVFATTQRAQYPTAHHYVFVLYLGVIPYPLFRVPSFRVMISYIEKSRYLKKGVGYEPIGSGVAKKSFCLVSESGLLG